MSARRLGIIIAAGIMFQPIGAFAQEVTQQRITASLGKVTKAVSFSKIVKIGEQTVSLSIGGKYWIEGPDQSPEWGIKSGITFLFPSGRPKP